jgi:HSP20 family protein
MYNFRFNDRDFQQFQEVAEKVVQRLGDVFNEVGRQAQHEHSQQYGHKAKVRLDVAEDGQNVYVYAELSGVRKEDVNVTLSDDNVLTISGEKKRPDAATGGDKNFTRVERRYGQFSRSVQIDAEIERERIAATFADGVLTITLPKLVPVQAKEFRVNIQ